MEYKTARIPVEINWDKSGITPSKGGDLNEVHRVSFRFFPKNGSEPFECFLETDLYHGYIDVPIGEYSIMVMNESVTDIYWSDFFRFSDINDYNKISATVVDDDVSKYDFYTPAVGEKFMHETHRLASWSMDDFSVTQELVTRTRAALTKAETDEFTLKVDMRRLTYDTKVVVHVKNLKSAQLMRAAMRGYSQKVYLSSAVTETLPATHLFTLNGRKFDEGSIAHGTTEHTFISFGKLPAKASPKYSLMLDAILINGSRHIPKEPFEYDVTNEINAQDGDIFNIRLAIELPEVDGDIDVGDWEDNEEIIIK
jgi:hypothetical protein